MIELSIVAAAEEAPDAVALVPAEGAPLTFAELATAAAAVPVADVPDDTPFVPVVADATVDTVLTLLALLERGVPALLLHPRLTDGERDALVAEAAAHAPPLPGTAAILFTSGTTGRPRGAQLSAEALVAAAYASGTRLPFDRGDRWLLSMPLAHVGGLSILTRALAARATMVLAPRFDPAALPALIARAEITHLSLVPTMLARVFEAVGDVPPPPTLRALLLGGAAAPAPLLARAAAACWPVMPTYGLTEACAQVTTVAFEHRFAPAGHGAGAPLPGVQVRIDARGHIQVRGQTLMSGYLGEAPLAPGAWFDTSDLGTIGDAHELHVHARRTDLIITGGENVYPAEIEDVLASCPGVAAACVFGLPDEVWGQIVAALVVPSAGAAPDPVALATAVAARLAPFRRPRRVAFVSALPISGAGKLDRAAAPALAAVAGLVALTF